MAWFDSHHNPEEVLAGVEGSHLARWCRLGVLNGMTLTRNNLSGSAVLSPLVDRRPTRLVDSKRVFSFTGWINVRFLFVTLQSAGNDPIDCSLLVY